MRRSDGVVEARGGVSRAREQRCGGGAPHRGDGQVPTRCMSALSAVTVQKSPGYDTGHARRPWDSSPTRRFAVWSYRSSTRGAALRGSRWQWRRALDDGSRADIHGWQRRDHVQNHRRQFSRTGRAVVGAPEAGRGFREAGRDRVSRPVGRAGRSGWADVAVRSPRRTAPAFARLVSRSVRGCAGAPDRVRAGSAHRSLHSDIGAWRPGVRVVFSKRRAIDHHGRWPDRGADRAERSGQASGLEPGSRADLRVSAAGDRQDEDGALQEPHSGGATSACRHHALRCHRRTWIAGTVARAYGRHGQGR